MVNNQLGGKRNPRHSADPQEMPVPRPSTRFIDPTRQRTIPSSRTYGVDLCRLLMTLRLLCEVVPSSSRLSQGLRLNPTPFSLSKLMRTLFHMVGRDNRVQGTEDPQSRNFWRPRPFWPHSVADDESRLDFSVVRKAGSASTTRHSFNLPKFLLLRQTLEIIPASEFARS